MEAMFVQELDDLGFLFHNAAVTHGYDGALLVVGEHYPLIGADPREVRCQIAPGHP